MKETKMGLPCPSKLKDWCCFVINMVFFYRPFQKGSATSSSMTKPLLQPFHTIDRCHPEDQEKRSVLSDLDGTLLRSSSSFPYFMLVAFEAGSPLRAVVLLLASPLIWVSYHLISEEMGIKLLIFISFAGLKVSVIKRVARAVLPKFYLEDMHPQTYKVFTNCCERYIVTANPRIMVEPFLEEFLCTKAVLGTEIQVTSGGYATGFVNSAPRGLGVLVGSAKARAVKQHFGVDDLPYLGLGDRKTDYQYMALCKEAYLVPKNKNLPPVPREQYLKPLVFHDGRMVCRPTPLHALTLLLWTPFGVILCAMRALVCCLVPAPFILPLLALLGCKLRVRGQAALRDKTPGVLFASTHRTLFDPLLISILTNRRSVSAVVYSLSSLSELLSPMKTVRLTRNRQRDTAIIKALLQEGDLVICPEGTTCREPYLLRFSSLFAELSTRIVPVATECQMSMFHGTTASGWKLLDPFFFGMNPRPGYLATFLEQLPREMTCEGGKSNHLVANHVQKLLADCLGFECTTLTRQDKYRVLAGHDGLVP